MCHHHHIICEHQIEIEVWPAFAEVYFQDEAHCNPANTQVSFDAIVYNAPRSAVLWKVCDLEGGPGMGSIDASGVYTAPPKGALLNGATEVVVAAAADDPFREARAFVTLIGRGPEPPPPPSIMVLPKRTNLYYRAGENDDYIDRSNTEQVFRALVANSDSSIDWQVDHVTVLSGDMSYLFCYTPPSPALDSGDDTVVTITAMLSSQNSVKDEAKVVLVNYNWPGIE
jgi:hypothetical protein